MVVKRGRRGPFLACSGVPACRNSRDVGSKAAPAVEGAEGVTAAAPAGPLVPLPDCPKCGAAMSLRRSARGPFCGCTKYPECKGTAPVPQGALPPRTPPRPAGVDCTACGKPMVIRTSRRGEFAGCSGYPKCRETVPMDQVNTA
jgi:DNA topoisomerase-1